MREPGSFRLPHLKSPAVLQQKLLVGIANVIPLLHLNVIAGRSARDVPAPRRMLEEDLEPSIAQRLDPQFLGSIVSRIVIPKLA